VGPVDPGHRPPASALGWALATLRAAKTRPAKPDEAGKENSSGRRGRRPSIQKRSESGRQGCQRSQGSRAACRMRRARAGIRSGCRLVLGSLRTMRAGRQQGGNPQEVSQGAVRQLCRAEGRQEPFMLELHLQATAVAPDRQSGPGNTSSITRSRSLHFGLCGINLWIACLSNGLASRRPAYQQRP
jgi:hypothetical protein